MTRARGRRLVAATAALIAVGGSLLSAAPAQAAPACHGGTCTGRNPNKAGCSSDAVTVREFTRGPNRVELRFSPACRATWSRWSNVHADGMSDYILIERYNFSDRLTARKSTTTRLRKGASGFTPMVGVPRAGGQFFACIWEDRQCTSTPWIARPW
ncbi:DUF2690 domain-containing protein [Micromonospora sp. CPCC 206061]|uniref:DUF2690 domain-containing protein n=1 Tax=Micromonospora sp. CPCC 206061 TaxID=3122410 RepID=UPI002FEE9D0B